LVAIANDPLSCHDRDLGGLNLAGVCILKWLIFYKCSTPYKSI
jgi:hypothetical protein